MTTTQSHCALTTGTWTIEPAQSEVGFTVRHLGMSKVRGRFNTFSGSVTIGDSLEASSVVAEIDLSSVDTNNADRDGHLRSADFFNAETNPKMSFESTAIRENMLAGNLTINGVTSSSNSTSMSTALPSTPTRRPVPDSALRESSSAATTESTSTHPSDSKAR